MSDREPDEIDGDDAAHEELVEDERARDLPPDTSEADALEQARSAGPPNADEPVRVPPDVPEADALEQAREVDRDDDYEH